MEQELINRFKKLDTTCVSDAMDKLCIPCGLHGIKPVITGKTICGTAYTVRYIPCSIVKGTVGDFLDDVDKGQVIVIDNNGRTDCTVWGDLMSLASLQRGIEGTLINGVCRDIPAIKKMEYPVYSKGHYMVTGKDRVQLDTLNQPVSISGVQVRPGDIILCDDSGAIVIPVEKAEEALKIAEEINTKEKLIESEIKKGSTLKEAREKAGYHKLQTK